MSPVGAPPAPAGTYQRVLDALGAAIVAGELPAGHLDTVEALTRRYGASRSIVREATRVLVQLGLLSARRRVGLLVLPRSSWNTLDPAVIRWRLGSAERGRQLTELRDLRRALEPEAARHAAQRARRPDRAALTLAVGQLEAAAAAGGGAAFLVADRRFHSLLLTMSGNVMMARLESVVAEALRERSGLRVADHDLALHRELAEAVDAGRPEEAARAAREIVDRTRRPTGRRARSALTPAPDVSP